MAINDIYRLAVECGAVNASGLVVNVFHYRQTTVNPVSSGAAELVNAFNTSLSALYVACFSSSAQLESYKARNLTVPTEGFDLTRGTPLAGTVTGDMIAPQNAELISWRTGLIGRSYRGRTYLPPTGESAVGSAGALGAGQLAAMAAFATAAMSIAATANWAGFQLLVYSPTLGTGTPVTSYAVRGGIVIQRKRGQ